MVMLTETTTGTNALEKVMENIPKAFELAGTCVEAIFDNPILTLFFSISMIGTGLSIFRKLKRTARS